MPRIAARWVWTILPNFASTAAVALFVTGLPLGASSLVPSLAPSLAARLSHQSAGLDSLTTIVPDTAAFALGNHNFERYTPWMCVAAAEQAEQVQRRSLADQSRRAQLQGATPELDTISPRARAVARTCGGNVRVATANAHDLSAVFTLALLMGDDSMARAAVRRQLSLAETPARRQEVLTDAAAGYASAYPIRLAEAEWTLSLADSLAHAEHANSLPVHEQLLDLWVHTYNRPRLLREAQRMIALGHTLDFGVIQYVDPPLIHAWRGVLAVAFYEQPDSIMALAQRGKEDLARFPTGREFPPGITSTLEQLFNFTHASVTAARDFLLPFHLEQWTGRGAIPPVTAQFWYPAPPKNWPPRGDVSLVLYDFGCLRNRVVEPAFAPIEPCDMLFHAIPEWLRQYGSQGFALIVVDVTGGQVLRSGPLATQAEADSIAWYYRTYRQWPATVGVVSSAMTELVPSPDGRLGRTDTTALGVKLKQWFSEFPYGPPFGPPFLQLFDRNGTLLFAGKPDDYGGLLDALISRAVRAPAGL